MGTLLEDLHLVRGIPGPTPLGKLVEYLLEVARKVDGNTRVVFTHADRASDLLCPPSYFLIWALDYQDGSVGLMLLLADGTFDKVNNWCPYGPWIEQFNFERTGKLAVHPLSGLGADAHAEARKEALALAKRDGPRIFQAFKDVAKI
jgi:hypothetical protein